MFEFTTDRLFDALQAQRALPEGSRLCLALSGGLDSMVLLHALAQLKELQGWQLRALHVDHGLQASATQWSRNCEMWARQLNIECRVLRVTVDDIAAQGVEAAARQARYAALRAELLPNEMLLTAHHADDQLETVLLALMRGAGLGGLAAMPGCTPFGSGWHLRPLLGFTRDALQTWAQTQQLNFIDDPTNADTRFDRNYLRGVVVPTLKTRWPAAAHTAARSASHLGMAQGLLDSFVAQDYAAALRDQCLDVQVLQRLSVDRRYALLRYWLRQRQARMPSTRVLQALDHDLLHAAADRVPCTCWDDVCVYRYRERLYLERRAPGDLPLELGWRWREALSLPAALGSLQLASTDAADENAKPPRLAVARLPETLTIRFRSGGERLRLPGEQHHRRLKKLLQDSAVLPWWRERLPLIFAGEQLVAVADLWVEAEFAAHAQQPGGRLLWNDRPRIYC